MTTSFQVLLCLCLWGLIYAAPQGRNVRWCVTSDTEEKKCNDLASSCTVHEIHLICVKKSCAEECKTAISNGEADAISLDSEDLYAASVKPHNLKPIMTEGHYTHRDFSLADQTPCEKERHHLFKGGQPAPGSFVPQCDEWGSYSPKQCSGSSGYCWCVNEEGKEIADTRTPPGQQSPTCEDQKKTRCLRHRKGMLGRKTPKRGDYVPDCDENGEYVPRQCHGTAGHCWCVNKNGDTIEATRTAPYKVPKTCDHTAATPCLKERQKVLGNAKPLLGAFAPQCDEKGNYNPQQCHGSTGHCWCVNDKGVEIEGTKTGPGEKAHECGDSAATPCLKERQKVLGNAEPLVGAFAPQCDKKGNYNPQQCHGSTGYCWCVNEKGVEIDGTKTAPGEKAHECGDSAATPCLKERQKVLGKEQPLRGAFAPQCDEKGNYNPQQCHGSTGYCWCVNDKGEEIDGTKTAPGEKTHKCGGSAVTPCLMARQKVIGNAKPLLGAFAPQCDEKGNYKPQQCHGSTGYCWCVNEKGEEKYGTSTPPGTKAYKCEDSDPLTCHYAVAVVKKSSTLQFDQLKGKRSCHSAVGTAAGWIAPLNALHKKNLLLWEGHENEHIEKAVSEFFLSSCAPGAKTANLCKQCAGQGDNCKRGPGEPYYGDEGAFRCLKEDKGDVAFVEDIVLSEEHSDSFELLCPDNTRKELSQYKHCNFGKIPRHAVVTRSTGDKITDITEYLLGAQKQRCKLFSSTHGHNLLFDDTTTTLIALPSAVDTFLFLGPELFNAIKTMHGEHPPSHKELRWCTLSQKEKLKCDDWSAVSGGAVKCTEPAQVEECILKIVKGEADLASIPGIHTYTALKCGLTPALEEYHNKDEIAPCLKHGAQYTEFGEFKAVAVVKKGDKDITWSNLKGKKSCHPGVGHKGGWVIPVSIFKKQSKSCDLGSFFKQSCAPGSDINSNLCDLCVGDPENTEAGTKCSLSDKEAYYGNTGAFRCLVEKGDVAFVSHTAVIENTDGKNSALWAKDLKSTDFELLCPDGSRAPVGDYKKCTFGGGEFGGSIFSREDNVNDVKRGVINQQSLYGRYGSEKDIFQMFSSKHGKDIFFRDDTSCLIDFDKVDEIDILYDYFGKENLELVHGADTCFPPSALASACAFHHG